MVKRAFGGSFWGAGLVCLAQWFGIGMASADGTSDTPVVGEATLVIGQATLFGVDGAVRSLARGHAIRAGERIETRSGGHVHVRFVDGGRLSVRPSSRLQIESYAHSPGHQQDGAIRFRLDEGVVRSITGAWGEAARDRFRLNTPIAAIGIKGTDFVVRTDSLATAASVYSGAIFVSPLSGCSANSGPCLNGQEKLLTADMKGMMVELSRVQSSPQFVAASELVSSSRRSASTGSGAATTSAGSAARSGQGAHDNGVVSEARTLDAVTQLGAVAKSPELPQLVWARHSWAKDPIGYDQISRSFEEASANGRMLVAVNPGFSLYREPLPGGGTILSTDESSVNFRLSGSAASFQRRQDLTLEVAKVESGMLSIDFAKSTFSTRLDVSSEHLGRDHVSALGSISASGVFRPASANASIVGATSLNGQEAGYAFEKAGPAGFLRGITLWGR